ncbi:hypothetical protein VTH06DRAFT_3404 [Thermothelomyces fergusii]
MPFVCSEQRCSSFILQSLRCVRTALPPPFATPVPPPWYLFSPLEYKAKPDAAVHQSANYRHGLANELKGERGTEGRSQLRKHHQPSKHRFRMLIGRVASQPRPDGAEPEPVSLAPTYFPSPVQFLPQEAAGDGNGNPSNQKLRKR